MKNSRKSLVGCTPYEESKNPGSYENCSVCLHFEILKKNVQLADTTYAGKCYPKKLQKKINLFKEKSSELCDNGAGFAEQRL